MPRKAGVVEVEMNRCVDGFNRGWRFMRFEVSRPMRNAETRFCKIASFAVLASRAETLKKQNVYYTINEFWNHLDLYVN